MTKVAKRTKKGKMKPAEMETPETMSHRYPCSSNREGTQAVMWYASLGLGPACIVPLLVPILVLLLVLATYQGIVTDLFHEGGSPVQQVCASHQFITPERTQHDVLPPVCREDSASNGRGCNGDLVCLRICFEAGVLHFAYWVVQGNLPLQAPT